jgi:hypothetical protein
MREGCEGGLFGCPSRSARGAGTGGLTDATTPLARSRPGRPGCGLVPGPHHAGDQADDGAVSARAIVVRGRAPAGCAGSYRRAVHVVRPERLVAVAREGVRACLRASHGRGARRSAVARRRGVVPLARDPEARSRTARRGRSRHHDTPSARSRRYATGERRTSGAERHPGSYAHGRTGTGAADGRHRRGRPTALLRDRPPVCRCRRARVRRAGRALPRHLRKRDRVRSAQVHGRRQQLPRHPGLDGRGHAVRGLAPGAERREGQLRGPSGGIRVAAGGLPRLRAVPDREPALQAGARRLSADGRREPVGGRHPQGRVRRRPRVSCAASL